MRICKRRHGEIFNLRGIPNDYWMMSLVFKISPRGRLRPDPELEIITTRGMDRRVKRHCKKPAAKAARYAEKLLRKKN